MPLFAIPKAIRRLFYVASSNIWSATTLTTGTWTNVISDQSFEVTGPDSVVAIATRGGAQVISTTLADTVALRLLIDVSSPAIVGYCTCANTTSYFSPFQGTGTVFLTGFSAGTHTVRLQYLVLVGTVTAYLRAASGDAGNGENLSIGVTEWTTH